MSLLAAVANDQHYPDARMTPREFARYHQHIRTAQPKMFFKLSEGGSSSSSSWEQEGQAAADRWQAAAARRKEFVPKEW